jgi:TRAP-type C4-dicarboxylate transport system permease small subunit
MKVRAGIERVEHRVEQAIKWIVVAVLAVLCVNVFVQVLLRYGLGYSSRWTLEVSRYLMIWAVLLAAGPALKHGILVGVDTMAERLPPRVRLAVSCLLKTLMGLFSVVIVLQAIALMRSQWEMQQLSPALEMPIALAYMAIPLGFSFYLFYLLVLIGDDLLHLRGR